MKRGMLSLGFVLTLIVSFQPKEAQATAYNGTCYRCAYHGGTYDWGEKCEVANGSGEGLECEDNVVRDHLSGTSMWGCSIQVVTPCAGGTFNYGGSGGGQNTCERDPMTGVCPASCFSCGGGAGGGGMRV